MIEQFWQPDLADFQVGVCGFQLGKAQQIIDQKPKPFGMPFHDLKNACQFFARSLRVFNQCLDISAQDRQRRSQFMRNVRDKIAPDLIESLQLRDIVKQNDRASC